MDDELRLRCDCGAIEHDVRLTAFEDEGDHEDYVSLELGFDESSLKQRLQHAVKLIFYGRSGVIADVVLRRKEMEALNVWSGQWLSERDRKSGR